MRRTPDIGGDAGESTETTDVVELLERVIPFRFLPADRKRAVSSSMRRRKYSPGARIVRQGAQDTRVYLIESGDVEILDPINESRHVTHVEAGHYFGEWESIFESTRVFEVRAIGETVCYSLDGRTFLGLIEQSRAFAQSLGTLLRDRQAIFSAFDTFKVELQRGVNTGYIGIGDLLPLYKKLEPALHAHAATGDKLDLDGLMYAVRRLPANITRTFAFLVTDEVPSAYGGRPDEFFPTVGTDARRRDIWEMLPGKDLVLLRNGRSDLIDLVTCICLYAVEAEKIRRKLSHPVVMSVLDSATSLDALPFTAEEAQSLRAIWPTDTVGRLRDIVRHRETFGVDVRRSRHNYNSRRSERWISQVADATRDFIGCYPSALGDDFAVHIISSNTHSVTNCINPWFREQHDNIVTWARSISHPYLDEDWEHPSDLIYALAREYCAASPERGPMPDDAGVARGVYWMKETASTGIQVQLIDSARLSQSGLDPAIRPPNDGKRFLIVNIDYAFGEQAQHIMRNLLMLFGRNLESINFLGKAGALVGRRGDILVPTAFVEQSTDFFQPMPRDMADDAELLGLRGRRVHAGPMLTVDGTLLQNRLMLRFYRKLWGCVGLEMEGSYYYRQVLESSQLGVIADDVALRFFYYVSDLPLEHGAALSSPLSATEGLPPLYAITRSILSGIFRRQSV